MNETRIALIFANLLLAMGIILIRENRVGLIRVRLCPSVVEVISDRIPEIRKLTVPP
jgi:hypothetical protein